MNRKKIMVVDDSALVRKLVCDLFKDRDDIETIIAPTGMIALDKQSRIDPDLVILDVEMPGLNGLDTLEKLLEIKPKLKVIMFSSLTEAGAGVSMDALAKGASDCLAKPTSQNNVPIGIDFLKMELLPRVEALLGLPTRAATSPIQNVELKMDRQKPATPPIPAGSIPGKFDILVIASSTGGPNALHAIFEKFSKTLPVPIVGVQHMPPVFTKLLAERLSEKSPCKVKEATEGEVILPGNFYLAPGDFHMKLAQGKFGITTTLNQSPPENSCRPAADVLFRSAVKLYGSRMLGLVLTGMGRDGTLGCIELKKSNGYLLAQDESSSVVWGMPGSVFRAGLVDEVLPIDKMARRIEELLMRRKI